MSKKRRAAARKPHTYEDYRLCRAIVGAFLYGLSFSECDEAFMLAPGEAERATRQHWLGRAYIPHRIVTLPPRGKKGKKWTPT